jgi:hypothetical protein
VRAAAYAGGELGKTGKLRSVYYQIKELELGWSKGTMGGVCAVISLGNLVFQLLAAFGDEQIALQRKLPFPQLWPDPIYRVPWSCSGALDDRGLKWLASSFVTR